MGASLRALTVVAVVAVWVVAAILLYRTSVPSLHLGGFDEHRYFTARELVRAHHFSRGATVIWLLSQLATIALLVLLARRLPRSVPGLGLGRIGGGIVVGLVLLVALWFVAVPFDLASQWWQHHWGLGSFDVGTLIGDEAAMLAASVPGVMLAVVIVVGFAVRLGRRWWLAAAPVFVALAFAGAWVDGWAGADGTHPVRNPELRTRIARVEGVEGVSPPIRVAKVSDRTKQANAFATGFDGSTHVVLWDTLLDGRFSDGEITAVVAHELGHVKHRHVLKGLGWFTLAVFVALYLMSRVTRRRGDLAEPANLPYALLVLAVVGLLAAPLGNLVSRRYEAEADWQALKATKDPASMRRLFERFGRTSLQDPDPPVWEYLWLENHPTLMQRIAMAERFSQRSGG
jgi:Zn-dependent protease with chaperone function